jgi:hypothetical protein
MVNARVAEVVFLRKSRLPMLFFLINKGLIDIMASGVRHRATGWLSKMNVSQFTLQYASFIGKIQ